MQNNIFVINDKLYFFWTVAQMTGETNAHKHTTGSNFGQDGKPREIASMIELDVMHKIKISWSK